jgi:hypothetical protein
VIASASFEVSIWAESVLAKNPSLIANAGVGFQTNPFEFWVKIAGVRLAV